VLSRILVEFSFLAAGKPHAVTVTVSFSFSVVVAVTVTVNNWLGLIGVTISGEFDVVDGAAFEVTPGGDVCRLLGTWFNLRG
jgi:hypothetical protein